MVEAIIISSWNSKQTKNNSRRYMVAANVVSQNVAKLAQEKFYFAIISWLEFLERNFGPDSLARWDEKDFFGTRKSMSSLHERKKSFFFHVFIFSLRFLAASGRNAVHTLHNPKCIASAPALQRSFFFRCWHCVLAEWSCKARNLPRPCRSPEADDIEIFKN